MKGDFELRINNDEDTHGLMKLRALNARQQELSNHDWNGYGNMWVNRTSRRMYWRVRFILNIIQRWSTDWQCCI